MEYLTRYRLHRIETLMSHHHQKNVSATLIKNAKNFKIFSCHLGGRDVTDSYKNENVPYHSTTIFFDILPHICLYIEIIQAF